MTRAKYHDNGQGVASTINAATATFGAAVNAVGTAKQIVGSLDSVTDFASGARMASAGLSAGAEAVGDIMDAASMFGGGGASENDWRVRLSIPNWQSFKNSPVLKPLKEAGGLIFPYTPMISIKSGATYNKEPVIHTNYSFNAYKTSEPGSIEITAPMNVEDADQALYWIAAVHYLRSVTKMFAGNDPKAGNPPPIVFLNGYGQYVFKNVPVVITNFSTTLPQDCDYITCDVVGSAMGEIAGIADSVGGLADSLGGGLGGLVGGSLGNAISQGAGLVSTVASGVGQVAGVLGTFGLGGSTSAGQAHVPTKSQFSVTVQPVYSRNSARKFSLDRFVQGGYVNNQFGYI